MTSGNRSGVQAKAGTPMAAAAEQALSDGRADGEGRATSHTDGSGFPDSGPAESHSE